MIMFCVAVQYYVVIVILTQKSVSVARASASIGTLRPFKLLLRLARRPHPYTFLLSLSAALGAPLFLTRKKWPVTCEGSRN